RERGKSGGGGGRRVGRGVAGRSPGARFASSVPGVRRRRPPGLGTARVAAALRARLQIPDPRGARPHRSALWAPSPLHSYDHLSHSLASRFLLTVSKTLGQGGARRLPTWLQTHSGLFWAPC
uniref:Uncharacterized protein n=1 Tax=Monodon monoceros TaxID=40151 RepID=A0A8C6F565_MONMO